jgi:hypothetical protein
MAMNRCGWHAKAGQTTPVVHSAPDESVAQVCLWDVLTLSWAAQCRSRKLFSPTIRIDSIAGGLLTK